MSHFLNVNTNNDPCSNEPSPTSPKLSREFSTLRVVSEESIAPPSPQQSSSVTYDEQFEDAPAPQVSPLEALAQLCAAEKDNEATAVTTHNQAPTTTTDSFQISQNDVLCGRGGLTNHHPGNVFFRQLVRIKQESYLLASKREKAGVAREIVDLIRKLNPPGRFLKKDPKNPSIWIEIGDRKAREKTSQALREGAPELREDLQQQQQQQQTVGIPKQHAQVIDEARLVNNTSSNKPMWWDTNQQSSKNLVTPTSSSDDFSNRSRIVSDDSVGAGYNHFLQGQQQLQEDSLQQPHLIVDQPQRDYYSGSKRSRDEAPACSVQEQNNGSSKRGPRLKLIKSRMEYCM